MSFGVVTALWIAKIFIVYTLMVVVLPFFVLRRLLSGRRLAQKFVISVVWGNFFYIMLVQFWGLLHISNRYVLIVSTLVAPAVVLFRDRKEIYDRWVKPIYRDFMRLMRRENSLRFLLRKFWRWIRCKIREISVPVKKFLRKNFLEGVFFFGCSAFLLYFFSVINHFGPRASDLVVHMQWINKLDEGILYGGGIYPFGMHALIYYIHAVFDIPIVRIVLLFGTVQTFYIMIMLLMFMKEICRFQYTPYLTYIAFVVGDYIQGGRFSRYYSTLPQEFGMIFLLPCAISLIRFFREIKKENAQEKEMKEKKLLYTQIGAKKIRRESSVQLWTLIISFGLTLSGHFYITIIAGILVVAASIAYIRFLFDFRMLRRLMVAAIIAVLIPIAPMAVAFATGTELEGSLYWALEVMGIDSDSQKEDLEEEADQEVENQREELQAEKEETKNITGTESIQKDQSQENMGMTQQELSLPEKLKTYLIDIGNSASVKLKALILNTEGDLIVWCICLTVLAVLVPVMWIFREWEYSHYLILVLANTGLLLLLFLGGAIGLPTLVDESRGSIFFSYTALTCFGLAADGVLLILSHIIRVPGLWRGASFFLTALFVAFTVTQGRMKEKIVNASSLQRDGAAICVYSIMEQYPDKKWTIVSCNEERQMIMESGWHYEVIDFLSSMENYQDGDEMYLPTRYVFFFIEKKVLNYALGYEFEDIDSMVSEMWAENDLPAKSGLSQYSGVRRIITNARMYYWAQEYQKRFPNEMKVFYEDDEFICYMIEQNEYYLNNFAIDYGYNSGGDQYDQ